jgi:transcriptional regulator with XRE-family HTH domain
MLSPETLNLLFGLKVRMLRQQQGMTLQQLVEKSGIALSFLHDIERGKKRPSFEKVNALAAALGTDFDYMMSVHGSKQLKPIVDLLESDFFKSYPLQVFGLEPAKLIELLSNEPAKINALIGTILKIARNHHLTKENLYLVALRSYQDMHDNYFPDLEEAARQFRRSLAPAPAAGIETAVLEKALLEKFDIRTDRQTLSGHKDLSRIRSWYAQAKKTLFLNKNLSSAQENFLLGRELGFQYLNIKERPYETIILKAESFEKLFQNFRASYFASALLMEENAIAADIQQCAASVHWEPERWLAMIDKYNVTPEMLLQRFTNVFPRHFGIKDLFFLRIAGSETLNRFDMTKELHLSGQQSPYSNEGGHYCRRWISIDILRRLRAAPKHTAGISIAAQVSQYWGQENAYFCISMAKPGKENVSLTIGLLVTDSVRRLFHFVDDPSLPRKTVGVTCETCSMPDCEARAAAPIEIERDHALEELERALKGL